MSCGEASGLPSDDGSFAIRSSLLRVLRVVRVFRSPSQGRQHALRRKKHRRHQREGGSRWGADWGGCIEGVS